MSAERANRRARKAASRRNNEFIGDMAAWDKANDPDNSGQMDRLHRNMQRIRTTELTPRQDEMLHLYYDLGLSIPRIAQQTGLHKSSVSRTLARGRAKLKRYLQYSL